MEYRKRISQILMIVVLGILILYAGFHIKAEAPEEVKLRLHSFLTDQAEESYLTGFAYVREGGGFPFLEWMERKTRNFLPLGAYVEAKSTTDTAVEDQETYEMILAQQAGDENEVDENGKLVDSGKKTETVPASSKSVDISMEKLKDFDYLLGNFYTVDGSTSINKKQLNAETLLGKSMKIDEKSDGPKILIYHTHSQEAFADSKKGDEETSIVGVGDYLAELLNETYHIQTLHHKGVYDLIDGKLDRSRAYELAEPEIEKILKENPSIEVVIDLHRDGVGESTHLVTEVNGRQTAQIMFFNGLSRTKANGDIAYLKNPYIEDNLAFSLQMQLAAAEKYPGFTRRIYLKSYRYNMHLAPKTLLVEAGAQTNTVEEMKNAMELLADTLDSVLTS